MPGTLPANEESPCAALTTPSTPAAATVRPPEIKPLSPERFKVQFTVNRDTHDNLELRCRAHNAYEAEQCGLGAYLFAREGPADYVSRRLGPDRV